MHRVIFPIEYEENSILIKYPDEKKFFSNTESQPNGTDMVADYSGEMEFSLFAKPTTDIAVVSDKTMINVENSFNFTTTLPSDTYFMPMSQQGTTKLKLVSVDVLDGKGTLVVTFQESGIFFIDESKLDTSISVNGVESDRFTLYVGE